jgi:Tol biopolymer transport system component
MNADGSNLKQLSPGPEDILAACTPDGRWVVYADNSFRNPGTIYRVSSDGGTPQKLAEGTVWVALSHHGDRLAWIKDTDSQQTLVLTDLNTGQQTATLHVPSTLHAVRSLTFAPDDESLFFIVRGESADSVYDLPLDGSAPTKQIEFRGARLSTLMVSPSGKYLGAVTAKPVSDAVLLEEHPR